MEKHLLAQIRNPVVPDLGSGTTADGSTIIGGFIGGIVEMLFIIAFILAFLYLILGGISWVTSGGDKGKLEEARNKVTQAIVGLIVVAAAWAIMTLVGEFLGIDFPELPFPSLPDIIGGGSSTAGGSNPPPFTDNDGVETFTQ